jgi:hypothetical protein
LVFVDAGDDLIMAVDVVTPSNPLVTPIQEGEFKKPPLDVNVSQWSCDKKPFKRMVRTQVDCLAWDLQLFPNPHALVIYLEFVLARGVALKRFKEC